MQLRCLLILILTSTISVIDLHGQKLPQNFGIEISPKYGFLIPHRATMGHLSKGHVAGGEISAVYQSNGKKKWHHDFLFPKYGVSAYFSDLGYKDVLGTAYGLHTFITLPFIKKNGWSFSSRLGAGVSYVTKVFDQKNNPKNNAISTRLNSLVIIGAEFEKQFKQSSLALGLDMSHLSNGAVKVPNLGLNLVYASIAYTRYFNEIEELKEPTVEENKDPSKWHYYSGLYFSSKQIYPTGGKNYGVVGLTNYIQRKFKTKCIVEAGVDASYNQSVIDDTDGEFTKRDNYQVGAYGAYVLPIHNLQLILGMGGYVLNKVNPNGMVYHRFGARFKLSERLLANITIKSHWAKADFFEYGLIYRWK